MAYFLIVVVSRLCVYSARRKPNDAGKDLSQSRNCISDYGYMAWGELEFRHLGHLAWMLLNCRKNVSWGYFTKSMDTCSILICSTSCTCWLGILPFGVTPSSASYFRFNVEALGTRIRLVWHWVLRKSSDCYFTWNCCYRCNAVAEDNR
ncbi:hypothetical protein D3C78_1102760 [compost metagenome]